LSLRAAVRREPGWNHGAPTVPVTAGAFCLSWEDGMARQRNTRPRRAPQRRPDELTWSAEFWRFGAGYMVWPPFAFRVLSDSGHYGPRFWLRPLVDWVYLVFIAGLLVLFGVAIAHPTSGGAVPGLGGLIIGAATLLFRLQDVFHWAGT